MFVGHFAIGFAAKQAAPRVSLGTLLLAGGLSDLLWIFFFAAGIEKVVIQPGMMPANSLNLVSIPYSHSLFMVAVWGALFAGAYLLLRHDSRGALMILMAVVSHWVLDVATHRPDMQVAPGVDMRFGLGLWNSRLGTFVVEGALWFGAVLWYARSTRPSKRAGVYAFWVMIVLLTALWIISLRGDPPPSLKALAVVDSVFFSVVAAWAFWMNRVRASYPAQTRKT